MNPWKGLKNLPRNVWLIAGATLINRAGSMVLPFLALYLTQEIKTSAAEAGLILTIYGVGALLSAPFVGKLSDRIGSLNILKISLFGSGALLLLFPLFRTYYSIAVYTFLFSIVTEAFRPAGMAFLSDQGEPDQRKTIFALNRLAINLGMSIGPVVGGFLTTINFNLLFYVDGLTSIAAALYILFVHWDKWAHSETSSADQAGIPKKVIPAYKDYNYLYYLLALMPVSIVFFQHFSTMPIFIVDELGHSKAVFGMLFAVNTVLIIFTEVAINTAMAKWKEWKLLVIGSLLTAIGFGALALFHEISLIIITIIIWTFGEMIIFPAASAYVAGIAPPGRRGEYMGLYQMLFSLCFILAPLLGTNVYEFFGSTALWIGTFIFGSLSAVMMIKLKNNH